MPLNAIKCLQMPYDVVLKTRPFGAAAKPPTEKKILFQLENLDPHAGGKAAGYLQECYEMYDAVNIF